jgi:hypothetical protein
VIGVTDHFTYDSWLHFTVHCYTDTSVLSQLQSPVVVTVHCYTDTSVLSQLQSPVVVTVHCYTHTSVLSQLQSPVAVTVHCYTDTSVLSLLQSPLVASWWRLLQWKFFSFHAHFVARWLILHDWTHCFNWLTPRLAAISLQPRSHRFTNSLVAPNRPSYYISAQKAQKTPFPTVPLLLRDSLPLEHVCFVVVT